MKQTCTEQPTIEDLEASKMSPRKTIAMAGIAKPMDTVAGQNGTQGSMPKQTKPTPAK